MTEKEVDESLVKVVKDFGSRHRDIEHVFTDHFNHASSLFAEDVCDFSLSRKLLLGAFFTKEYSIQAAALFNPSIVSHPDQTGYAARSATFYHKPESDRRGAHFIDHF